MRRLQGHHVAIGSAVLAFAGLCGLGAYEIGGLRAAASWVGHTHQVIGHLNALDRGVVEAETDKRAFVLTGDESYATAFESARAGVRTEIDTLRELCRDNAEREVELEDLRPIVERRLDSLADAIAHKRARPDDMSGQARHVLDKSSLRLGVLQAIQKLVRAETELLEARGVVEASRARRSFAALLVAPLVALVALVLGILRSRKDRGARRAAEQERNRFFQLTTDLLAVVGDDGRVLDANTALRAMVGEEEIVGRDLAESLRAEPEVVTAGLERAAGRAGEPHEFDLQAAAEDGSPRWLQVSAVRAPDEARTFVSAHDVTARHAAEQRLRNLAVGLERANDALSLMSEMMGMLNTCEDVREARPVLSSFLARLSPGDGGALYAINAEKSALESVAAWGGFEDGLYAPQDCWALRRGRPHEAPAGDRALACNHGAPRGEEVGTLCIPMMARGEAIGVLVLERRPNNELDEPLLVRLGEELSLAIANLRLRASLRNLSVRDSLTGLFNRRYLEETLEREVRRSERSGQPLSVIVADLDHFKMLNDTQGHQAGDEALQAIAAVLARGARAEDVVCRYGGEEFVILLPGCALDVARQRAEKLRAAVHAVDIIHRDRRIGPVTASFGVAAMPQHGSVGQTLVRRADAALYRAKALGRDRVEIANRASMAGPIAAA